METVPCMHGYGGFLATRWSQTWVLQEGVTSSVFSPLPDTVMLKQVTPLTDPVTRAAPWDLLNEQQ